MTRARPGDSSGRTRPVVTSGLWPAELITPGFLLHPTAHIVRYGLRTLGLGFMRGEDLPRDNSAVLPFA